MVPNLSDFTLEQYLLGELPPEEQERLANLVTHDPGLRERVQRLSNRSHRFLVDHPASAVLTRQEFQPRPRPPSRSGRPSLSRLAVAGWGAAAVVLVLPMVFLGSPSPDNRAKGGSGTPGAEAPTDQASGGISVFLLQGENSLPLASGTLAHKDDRIQVALKTTSKEYALLVSIDGNGQLTLHAPNGLTSPLELAANEPVLLPFAYQLDDAPSFERFVLVTGPSPFDPQRVWTEVQTQTTTWLATHPGVPPVIHLDQGLHVRVFDIRKPGRGPS